MTKKGSRNGIADESHYNIVHGRPVMNGAYVLLITARYSIRCQAA